MSSQNILYHVSAEPAVVFLQRQGELLGQQCGLPSQKNEHRHLQAGPGLRLPVHTWRITVARRTGKTLQPREQAKDAASTSALWTLQPPYAGAYLQLSGGSRDGISATVVSRPSHSIMTRHMQFTTDSCPSTGIATLCLAGYHKKRSGRSLEASDD
jgi:hypothetical protein